MCLLDVGWGHGATWILSSLVAPRTPYLSTEVLAHCSSPCPIAATRIHVGPLSSSFLLWTTLDCALEMVLADICSYLGLENRDGK